MPGGDIGWIGDRPRRLLIIHSAAQGGLKHEIRNPRSDIHTLFQDTHALSFTINNHLP